MWKELEKYLVLDIPPTGAVAVVVGSWQAEHCRMEKEVALLCRLLLLVPLRELILVRGRENYWHAD